MKIQIVFIADVFVEDGIIGGGELNNQEYIRMSSVVGYQIHKIKSHFVDINYLKANIKSKFIIANFIGLKEECKEFLIKNCKYTIYEHDHKYLKTRNPSVFENLKAPQDQIINYDFYKNSKAVFCQSGFHADIVRNNLGIENVFNLGGNLWSAESLKLLEELSRKKKKDCCSILDSPITHKNTSAAIEYCNYKKWDYRLVKSDSYIEFLYQLGSNEKFVFFPQTAETLSRIVVEARMMGMTVITNKMVGATKEPWFKFKGLELVEIMRQKREEIPKIINEVLSG